MSIDSSISLSRLPKLKIAFENARKGPQKPEKFYACAQSVYILSRFVGLFPFSIKYDVNGHMKSVCVKIFDAIWFAGAISINLFFIYFTIDFIKRSNSNQTPSTLSHFGAKIFLIFGLLNTSLSIVLDLLNRNRLLKISKDLFAFDAEVTKSHIFFRIILNRDRNTLYKFVLNH